MATAETTTTLPVTQASPAQTEIVVHHLQDSRSQRIIWLLEELKLKYTVKQYMRVKGRAPKELYQISPLGKSPVISDGNIVVAESAVIIEYLLGKYDTQKKYLPASDSVVDAERRQYAFWMHFAEGSMMGTLVLKQVFSTARPQIPFLVRPVFDAIVKGIDSQYTNPDIKKNFDYIEAHLKENEWFAGARFTGADIQMSFPMEIASRAELTEASHPKIFAWRKRVANMQSYQDALKHGGMAYQYALKP